MDLTTYYCCISFWNLFRTFWEVPTTRRREYNRDFKIQRRDGHENVA